MGTFEPLERLLARLLDAAPQVLLAVAVALAGLAFAFIARAVTRWLARRSGLEALGERLGTAKLLYPLGFKKGLADVLAQLAFWAVLLLTAMGVAELSGLSEVADAVSAVIGFLPQAVAAGGVLLGGFWLATVLRELVQRVGARREDLSSPQLAGQIVYYSVVVVTVTLAADQAGIETDLVQALVKIAATCLLASLGLAFALGGRDTFKRVVARFYTQRMVRKGDRLAVRGVEGVVVGFAPLSIVLRDGAVEHLVPYDVLYEDLVQRKTPDETSE